jgi:hypothetical protein
MKGCVLFLLQEGMVYRHQSNTPQLNGSSEFGEAVVGAEHLIHHNYALKTGGYILAVLKVYGPCIYIHTRLMEISVTSPYAWIHTSKLHGNAINSAILW